jgi:hypothetical protein
MAGEIALVLVVIVILVLLLGAWYKAGIGPGR